MTRIPAHRGSIYDAKGRLLAYDSLLYEAWLDLEFIRRNASESELELLLKNISDYFAFPKEEVLKKINSDSYFMLLGKSNNLDEMMRKITPVVRKYISIELNTERLSLKEYGLSKIVGSLDGSGRALSGIEKSYDNVLRGKKDGYVRKTLTGTLKVNPEDGNDVYLSIDLDLQKMVYDVLSKGVRKNKADGGIAILMESKTGKILAYANTYDWDVGLMGIFEPGSTIKPIIYGIALETFSITEESTFLCNGIIQPIEGLDIFIRDTEGEKHGIETFRDAIRNSCNVATTQVARAILNNIGKSEFYRKLIEAGFGRKTGVDLYGEIKGLFQAPSDWSLISPYQFAIGQGIGVTIFQLLRALNTYAADGNLLIPSFVKAVGNGTEIREIPPKIESRIFSSKLVKTMIPVLESVVASGTGTRAQVEGLRIGGKTGTAQKATESGYSYSDYYSLFWGFFPVDAPKYSLLVMIDNPRAGEYYGGTVAGPIFSEIVKNIYGLHEETPEPKHEIYSWKTPQLIGYTLHDVIEIKELLGIEKLKIHGTGRVVKQLPEAGAPLKPVLEVWLSTEEK
ncbi:penicillin-binding transpeptidase domain-containing protein [Kosmotoga pacifica]|uniref:Peptidoglycan glycosyltransferase n=1 Tax=Kosmotoga pacifica TaxID=1330330 RepID=A0A0G2ZCP9_9BACT|nr:penicillin-binding transpeptidase domain-containing protein [Kosmotoga pacifica]AKI97881.1 peptidoglycan glycosyltransferase [Kosmotoga pacifica]